MFAALPLRTPAIPAAIRRERITLANLFLPTSRGLWVMPWRRKPAPWLRYWEGPINREAGFSSVLVYCVGPPKGRICGHCGRLPLKKLPDWDWRDISAHFRCTQCGTVGYVDTRMDWCEVIDFNKGVG